MQATTQTTTRFFKQQMLAVGLAASIVMGGAAVVGASELDLRSAIDGSSVAQRSMPAFNRPADRPALTGATIASARPAYHRPADRPTAWATMDRVSTQAVTLNRPTDRP